MQKVIYVLLQQHAERYWETNYGDQSDIDDSGLFLKLTYSLSHVIY